LSTPLTKLFSYFYWRLAIRIEAPALDTISFSYYPSDVRVVDQVVVFVALISQTAASFQPFGNY